MGCEGESLHWLGMACGMGMKGLKGAKGNGRRGWKAFGFGGGFAWKNINPSGGFWLKKRQTLILYARIISCVHYY